MTGAQSRRAARTALFASRVGAFVRAGDWWDHKILPLLAVYVATTLVLRVPLARVWLSAAALLAALSALAAFAALINDLCDADDDRLAGKPNLLLRHSRPQIFAALSAALALGCAFAWLWRDDPALDACYLAAWAAFALYSLPPVRLKARGGWGVLAIAMGEAALPSLVGAQLCGHAAVARAPLPWLAAVALWSFCHGTRAILWHQLRDAAADAHAAIDTFARRHGVRTIRRIAAAAVFPAEIAALGAMLAMVGSVLPWLGLALYLCIILLRMRRRSSVPVLVDPVANHVLLMQDYYVYYLPVALIAAAAARNRLDAIALLVWLALFPGASLRVVRGPFRLLRRGLPRHGPK